MKITLVDLCAESDIQKEKYFNKSIQFLKKHGIDYIDFASGKSGIKNKISLFHRALASDADLIWFVRGGTKCIESIQYIDWGKVVKSKKLFLGSSDFTHFSTIAVEKKVECYYGPSLKSLVEKKRNLLSIIKFLKTGKFNTKTKQVFGDKKKLKSDKIKIKGGHLVLFNFLQSLYDFNLKGNYLFIEHHYGKTSDVEYYKYFLQQLLYLLKIKDNLPLGFIVSIPNLVNQEHKKISVKTVKIITKIILSKFNLPIYFCDSEENLIKLKK